METILVTGANRGIGLELTRRYLDRGDRVIATCRDQDAAHALRSLEARATPRLTIAELDVRDGTALTGLAAQIDGPIDILINNAGVMPERQGLGAMDYDAWSAAFDIHAIAPFRAISAFRNHLGAAARPRAIIISSQMGALNRNSPGAYAYRSSKAAANKVAQLLAYDLKAEGIVVCPIHPGWVQTDMGGVHADLSVSESGAGLVRVIDALDARASGRFFTWAGDEHVW